MRNPTALSACALLTMTLHAQDAPPGRALFEKTCARCHGADGNGGEMGRRSRTGWPRATTSSCRADPRRACRPRHAAEACQRRRNARSDRSCAPSAAAGERPIVRMKVPDHRRQDARRRSPARASTTCSCCTDDNASHLLRRAGDRFREVTSEHRLAGLQRRSRRQPLHHAAADHQGQRRAPRRRSGSSPCRTRRACR